MTVEILRLIVAAVYDRRNLLSNTPVTARRYRFGERRLPLQSCRIDPCRSSRFWPRCSSFAGLSLVRPCCSSSVIELESRGGRRGLGSQSSILSPSSYRQVFSFGSLLSPTSASQRHSGIHSSG